MEVKCISQTTANLIMDALFCAWMEFAADHDEERIEEGVEWTRKAFIAFCNASNIDLVEKKLKMPLDKTA